MRPISAVLALLFERVLDSRATQVLSLVSLVVSIPLLLYALVPSVHGLVCHRTTSDPKHVLDCTAYVLHEATGMQVFADSFSVPLDAKTVFGYWLVRDMSAELDPNRPAYPAIDTANTAAVVLLWTPTANTVITRYLSREALRDPAQQRLDPNATAIMCDQPGFSSAYFNRHMAVSTLMDADTLLQRFVTINRSVFPDLDAGRLQRRLRLAAAAHMEQLPLLRETAAAWRVGILTPIAANALFLAAVLVIHRRARRLRAAPAYAALNVRGPSLLHIASSTAPARYLRFYARQLESDASGARKTRRELERERRRDEALHQRVAEARERWTAMEDAPAEAMVCLLDAENTALPYLDRTAALTTAIALLHPPSAMPSIQSAPLRLQPPPTSEERLAAKAAAFRETDMHPNSWRRFEALLAVADDEKERPNKRSKALRAAVDLAVEAQRDQRRRLRLRSRRGGCP